MFCFPCVCGARVRVCFARGWNRLKPAAASDDLTGEKEKNKHLQEEMEATLHDIQNM